MKIDSDKLKRKIEMTLKEKHYWGWGDALQWVLLELEKEGEK